MPPSGIYRIWICCLLVWIILAGGLALSGKEDPVRKTYKIPSGKAITTLKEAAQQGEVDILFAANVARGVRTNAIEGEFTPLEALDRMLAGTSLSTVEDRATGAFAVIRSPRETDFNSLSDDSKNLLTESNNTTNMKKQTNATGKFLAGLLAVLGTASAPNVSAQEADEEVYQLTPFEISASEDTGYIATSTLAGTRMRMNLNDVGSSISVFTEELMDDLGAVDNETLLAYGLGTEVGGARGNFINPNTEGLENDNLIDPQSNNRIRGLTNADTTRNYFKSDVPWDGYNTHRIDVQRGANSILFGLGSPAGIINNSTDNAGFYNENMVRIGIDKFSSRRLEGSFNRVLIEDQLAIRLDFLFDNKEFRQEPAYEDDERVSISATYQPKAWNNESTTARFSANFEDGKIRANRPRNVIPLDFVSSFFLPAGDNGFVGSDFANGGIYGPNNIQGPAGKTYDWIADEDALDNIAWLGTANNPWPVFAYDARNPGNFTVFEDRINSKGSFLEVSGRNSTAGQTAIVVNDGAYVNPVYAPERPQDKYSRGVNQNVFGTRQLSTIGKQRVANDNGVAFAGFWRDPSLSSTDQFDFMNYLIDGDNKLEQQNFEVLELQFRNTFLNDRLGYQLSFFRQDMDFRQDANTGTIFAPAIQVEANSTDPLSDDLDNLASNPNAGRAYIDYELRLRAGTEDIRNREAKQAQIFAMLDTSDFSDSDTLTYLFGRHNFTGLFKNRQLERFRREFNSIGTDEATIRTFGGSGPDDPDLNPRFNEQFSDPGPGARMVRLSNAFGSVQPRIRVYLDAQGPNLTQIQPFTSPILESGSYPIRGFVANPNPGFTAVEAAEPWMSPRGDDLLQADNPANYSGTIGNKGSIGIVKALDGPDALEYLTARRFYDMEDVDTKAFVWSGSFLGDALVGMYGWREDKVKQLGLEHDYGRVASQNDIGTTGGPNFDPNSSFVRLSEGDFQSRNWSVKLNASRLFFDLTGMEDNLPFDIAFLYNAGEVQNPQPGRRNVLLQELAPSTGRTIDRSIAISTKDGRYNLRVTKYDTVQANANAGSVAASENWRIEQVLSNSVANGVVQIEERRANWTDAVLDNGDDIDDPNEINPDRSQFIRDQGFDSVIAWGESIASAYRKFENELFTKYPAANSWVTRGGPGTSDIGIIFPDDTVFIEDNESFGTEIEFMARPTNNWNIAVNASKTEVLRSKVFGDEVNEMLDLVVGALSGPAGQVPLWGPEGQMGLARTAPFLGQLITNRALLGTPTGELRKWKYNLITNYNFSEGFLNGFGIGAGYRWEDNQVIGFPPIYINPVTGERLPDASRPDKALSVDLSQPFTDTSRETADLWLKYSTKLTDKIDWRIQLNIFNVFDDKGTVPLFVNPDGTFGTLGIREGRSWQITNTFEF